MNKDKIIQTIQNYVWQNLPVDIVDVEENCGFIWITDKSGKVYTISIDECDQNSQVNDDDE